MQKIGISNSPVVTGIYDPNQFRARHHRSTILVFLRIKGANFSYSTYPKLLLKYYLLAKYEKKTAEMGQILANFLTESAYEIAYPLSEIINLLVKLSIFPEACRIAKLKPLFRKDSKTDPRNYRPTSLPASSVQNSGKSIH